MKIFQLSLSKMGPPPNSRVILQTLALSENYFLGTQEQIFKHF